MRFKEGWFIVGGRELVDVGMLHNGFLNVL